MKAHFFGAVAVGAIVMAPAPAVAETSQEVEQVVVSAEKREERAVNVPITIISKSSEELERSGVTGVFDLSMVAPAVRVDHYGVYTQPTIRGIGTQDVLGPGANSNVAIYVDGFYQPSQAGNIFDFANVEQVDVLKGPQGTLFGQNATGGAIVITTADPAFTPGGHLHVGYGSFNDFRAGAYFTAGLTDTLAADVSLYYRDSDNYFNNVPTGDPTAPIHNYSIRSKLLYQPNDRTRFVLTLAASDVEDPTGLSENTHNPIAAFYHDAFAVPMIHTENAYDTSLNHRVRAKPVTYSASLKSEFDLGWGELISYSQFRKQNAYGYTDLDGTTINYWNSIYREKEQTITQELNLTNKDQGPLKWLLGAFYYNDIGFLSANAFNDFFNTGTNSTWIFTKAKVVTNSYAFFADGTYQFGDNWFLTAGVRFTNETKSLHSSNGVAPFTAFADDKTWNSFTPRVALRYALTPDSNIYASVSQGFMSGNYNYSQTGAQEPVKQERVTQYEIGYKRAAGRWSLDTSVYLSEYRDLQVYTYDTTCNCFQFSNAPKAQIYGAEAQLFAALTDNVTANIGIAYTHARYKEFVGIGVTGDPVIPPNYGYATAPADFSGAPMIRTPDWTAVAGLNYRVPVDFGELNFGANVSYSSRVPFAPDLSTSQGAYALLNLNASWTSTDSHWRLTVAGQNVTDKEYLIFSASGFLGNNYIFGAPASWNARVDYRF